MYVSVSRFARLFLCLAVRQFACPCCVSACKFPSVYIWKSLEYYETAVADYQSSAVAKLQFRIWKTADLRQQKNCPHFAELRLRTGKIPLVHPWWKLSQLLSVANQTSSIAEYCFLVNFFFSFYFCCCWFSHSPKQEEHLFSSRQ